MRKKGNPHSWWALWWIENTAAFISCLLAICPSISFYFFFYLQCVASHPETRIPFLNAHIPLYLYPFLNSTSKTRPFEYLRLTSLGVIGALVKVDYSEVIGILLQTEIILLCLRTMEMGSELSKTFTMHTILVTLACSSFASFRRVHSCWFVRWRRFGGGPRPCGSWSLGRPCEETRAARCRPLLLLPHARSSPGAPPCLELARRSRGLRAPCGNAWGGLQGGAEAWICGEEQRPGAGGELWR
ncbi:uncharacterized protein [Triticum aestivum]|uniref:uncharacterized protein isoform X3 n=1 Tax=Triticum aestivum TaxID=4565 RepID=UPI001D008BD1|nr:uncharacterized protein LOC123094046 isoform X3 [Triticum aestivum]